MSAEPFNSQGGFSSGIPPVLAIDANGNVVSNVVTTGNVIANVVYADYFKYGNGQPLTVSAAGSNTQIQYNNNGSFGASNNFTFDSTNSLLTVSNISVPGTVTFSDASNVHIFGGNNGYFLQTDGAGNLTWAVGGGGGNGTPGGSNTQVQFNDNGSFGGDVDFTFNKSTNTLTVPTVNAVSHITAAGNITSNGYFVGDGSFLSNVTVDIANTVAQNAQPNITSVGTLTSLDLSGPITSTSNISISGNISAGNINLSRNVTASSASFTSNVTVGNTLRVNATATLQVLGNINAGTSPNVYLGTLSNIRIDGGLNGYFLQTDGTGNLSWAAGGGGGGNGTPGGSNTQIQYNNSGAFGGSAFLTFNDTTNTLNVAGNLIANSLEIGSGVYKFSKANVYFATTSTTANTILLSLNANSISSVDFTIIATDSTAGNRQVSKISAVLYQSSLNYNEYSTLQINGPVGNFTMAYSPGNIIVPAAATLYVEPETMNLTSYKIQITQYEP